MKTIWITGASSGIGKSLALKFANEGWQVAASARREDLLNQLSESNQNISPFPLDVTSRENCEKIFEKIKNKFENIDTCFFSTGTWDPKKEKEIDIDQMKKVMEVNFFGTLNCIKAVEMYFKEKKNGNISIVSSIAGYRGLPNSTGYGASKAALTIFCEGLLMRCAKKPFNIRIFKAGYITSPMTINKAPAFLCTSPKKIAKILLRNPNKRGIEYLPFWWWPLMLLIKILPINIVRKLK